MKPNSWKLLAAIALTVSGLTLGGCTQAPAPTAAAAPDATPAPTTTVIENVHRDDARRPDDRDRAPDVHVDIRPDIRLGDSAHPDDKDKR
jgi:hypothetical protein